MALTKEFFDKVLDEATQAANAAGDAWLAAAKPRYAVYEADLEGKQKPGTPTNTILDVCGFAWLIWRDKRSTFYKSLRKHYGRELATEFCLRIPHKYRPRQEMGLAEACARAAYEVFVKYGFGDQLRVETRID